MPNRVVVDGTDVEIAYFRAGENVVLRISKSGREVLNVHVTGAARETYASELEKFRKPARDFIIPIGGITHDTKSGEALDCSFCGKSQHEVRKLIAGPKVFICDECGELVADIIGSK